MGKIVNGSEELCQNKVDLENISGLANMFNLGNMSNPCNTSNLGKMSGLGNMTSLLPSRSSTDHDDPLHDIEFEVWILAVILFICSTVMAVSVGLILCAVNHDATFLKKYNN